MSFRPVLLVIAALLPTAATAAQPELRCGWFANPTPGNVWLTDRDGDWLIGMQGGYQAEGDWPAFADSRWVKTNGNYGYGCACLRVSSDRSRMRITRIHGAKARSLQACEEDPALDGDRAR